MFNVSAKMSIFCRSQRVEWLVGGLTTGGLEAAWARGKSQVDGGVSTWTKWNFGPSLFRRYYDCSGSFTVMVNIKPDFMGQSGLCRICIWLMFAFYCLKPTFELQSRWSWGPWSISGSLWARSCRGRWSCAHQSSRPWPPISCPPLDTPDHVSLDSIPWSWGRHTPSRCSSPSTCQWKWSLWRSWQPVMNKNYSKIFFVKITGDRYLHCHCRFIQL